MKCIVRYIVFCIIGLALTNCSSSTQSIDPSEVTLFADASGINEELTSQEDTLEISLVRIIFENFSMGYNTGPPYALHPEQEELSFNADNADHPINIVTRTIPPGTTFRSLGFTIALSENNSVDHPEFSVYVTGIYNGENFEFGTDTTFTHDLNFKDPLEVPSQGVQVELTIKSAVLDWFRDDQGGILDPMAESSKPTIESKIKPSFTIEMERIIQ